MGPLTACGLSSERQVGSVEKVEFFDQLMALKIGLTWMKRILGKSRRGGEVPQHPLSPFWLHMQTENYSVVVR